MTDEKPAGANGDWLPAKLRVQEPLPPVAEPGEWGEPEPVEEQTIEADVVAPVEDESEETAPVEDEPEVSSPVEDESKDTTPGTTGLDPGEVERSLAKHRTEVAEAAAALRVEVENELRAYARAIEESDGAVQRAVGRLEERLGGVEGLLREQAESRPGDEGLNGRLDSVLERLNAIETARTAETSGFSDRIDEIQAEAIQRTGEQVERVQSLEALFEVLRTTVEQEGATRSELIGELSEQLGTRLEETGERMKALESSVAELVRSDEGSTEALGELRRAVEELRTMVREASAAPPVQPVPRARPRPVPVSGRLDLNAATFEEFRGVGLSITQAARVVGIRDERGGFDSIDDLDDVPGLPEDLRTELRERLTGGAA